MIAAVIRHAKVDIEWDFWQTSKEYDQGCADYDTAPVLPVEVHLPDADFKTIYVSDLSRTAATARQVVGDRELTATALINEVPEKSGFDTELKLPGMLWSGISRIQWFLCNGFFMITLLRVMKKHGFQPDHTRLEYSNGECVVCRREDNRKTDK